MKNEIGKRIAKLRKSFNMNQEELAIRHKHAANNIIAKK